MPKTLEGFMIICHLIRQPYRKSIMDINAVIGYGTYFHK